MYVDVKDKLDRPVPGLTDKNFRVYEDGKLVTTSKGKRARKDLWDLPALKASAVQQARLALKEQRDHEVQQGQRDLQGQRVIPGYQEQMVRQARRGHQAQPGQQVKRGRKGQ